MEHQQKLRERVCTAYSRAAHEPGTQHPFPVGRQFAHEVGYPADMLAELPASAVDAFAGVSNVAVFADIDPGGTVLDLGCGAGLDAMIASRRTGSAGRVYGIDFSDAMLERAQRAAHEAKIENITFRKADAERLPLADASIDVALVNGIFNLNPDRERVFRELARVVRRGGQVFGAELVLIEALPEAERACTANWFA